jgi:hypothetical protein
MSTLPLTGTPAGEPPTAASGAERLPAPRGPLSSAVLRLLIQNPDSATVPAAAGALDADPLGEDLQLALYLCYELHYHGLPGVADAWEWHPGLLGLRARAEKSFLGALRRGAAEPGDGAEELEELLAQPSDDSGAAPTRYLLEQGTWWQLREFLVHRSVYHLKEADPHAWAIPRLGGRAKAALVAVEYEEAGAGRPARMRSRLYADLMGAAGLDPGSLRYLDRVPAPALALVNMLSLFALHRSLRGALAGHVATAEISAAPGARRMLGALRRLNAPPLCVRFYGERAEPDAVREQLMRNAVALGLVEEEPALAADIVLGIRATDLLEERFGRHVLTCWERGVSSLRRAG